MVYFSSRDHAGGNLELAGLVKGLTICGGDERIGAMNKKVGHGDKLKVGNKARQLGKLYHDQI